MDCLLFPHINYLMMLVCLSKFWARAQRVHHLRYPALLMDVKIHSIQSNTKVSATTCS